MFDCQCIELLGANCFTTEQYSKLIELLKDAMEMTFSRASERLKKREDEDYDEQVEEELEEEVCGWGEGREGGANLEAKRKGVGRGVQEGERGGKVNLIEIQSSACITFQWLVLPII